MKVPKFPLRKGNVAFATLATIAITLIVAVLTLAFGVYLNEGIKDDQAVCPTFFVYSSSMNKCLNASNTTAGLNVSPNNLVWNVTAQGDASYSSISTYLPTLALIAIFVIVIGAIAGILYFKRAGM